MPRPKKRRPDGAAPSRSRRAEAGSAPGPGPLASARAMSLAGPHLRIPLDREVDLIEAALEERGVASRRELSRRVGGRRWGPGRFSEALTEAVREGRIRRLPKGRYGPVHDGRAK